MPVKASISQPDRPAVKRPKDAARHLAISRSHLYVLRAKGILKPVSLGGRAVGFLVADLDNWLSSQRNSSDA